MSKLTDHILQLREWMQQNHPELLADINEYQMLHGHCVKSRY